MNNLGSMYYNGVGVEIDYVKAKELYEKAASLNNSRAFHNLGKIYFFGNGVPKDYVKAKELFEKASQYQE